MNERKQEITALVAFCVPLILSGILQQMFNWADAFIVGNFVGEDALAAVGATTQLCNLFTRTISGFTSGVAILSARYFGAGQIDKVKNILGTFLAIIVGVFAISMASGLLFTDAILTAMYTPLDIFDLAKDYIRIILIGLPFLATYNIYYAVLRGIGDSKTPFMVVTYSGLLNVVLDYLFVAVLGYSVRGAAFATTLSYIFMAVFVVGYSLIKHKELTFKFERKTLSKKITIEGLKLSIPITAQSLIRSFGNLYLQGFMNTFGTSVVAAITTAYRIDSVAVEPVMNFGTGVSTMVSQSVGAGDKEKAKRHLNTGMTIMAGVSLILTGFVLVFGENLIAMFGTSVAVTEIGGQFFRSLAAFYVIYALATANRNYLEGSGDVVYTSFVVTTSLVLRIMVSYALKGVFGPMIIAYAEGISWIYWLIMYRARYYYLNHKSKMLKQS